MPLAPDRHAARQANGPWSRGAAIYQIYPRSFFDSNGDGVGDLPGVIAKLDYIASLGVDAIWLSPFYLSPMADFGYDVADHKAVDPVFGTLQDFDALVARATQLGLRVLVDLVVGHTSVAHAWFAESRASRDNDKADWFVWADPRPDGSPPNNWLSVFSGPAWKWEPRRRQYFLHHFLPEQPALNVCNAAMRAALVDVAAFWLDRGVSGLRLDAIDFLAHDPNLRSNRPSGASPNDAPAKLFGMQLHQHDMLHPDGLTLLRDLRKLADSRGAMLLGEVSSQPGAFDRIAAYTGARGPLHSAYTLAPMRGAFDFAAAKGIVAAAARDDGSVCWAFSNHDTMRVASRWCAEGGVVHRRKLELITAFHLALRGEICLYQGEELGLTEADLAPGDMRDPFGLAYYPQFKGRDGSRTPIPWVAGDASNGFTEGAPWLPAQTDHGALAVDAQENDPGSLLAHWRDLLAWRKRSPEIRHGALIPLDTPEPVTGFVRESDGRRTICLFNFSDQPAVADVDGARIELGAWTFRFLAGALPRTSELAAV
ncbi:MAG: alpha-glucosidase [Hyphomicrobiales bacterium]|nr:alpha-glucosidase [Hyphomicrobiales bacterium]